MFSAPLLQAAAVLLLLITRYAAAVSHIRLINSTLAIGNATNTTMAADAAAQQYAAYSLGLGGPGSPGAAQRADYGSAYISNTTLQPIDGVNPLDSYATVEANNSYILITAGSYSYQSLELLLGQNNTFAITDQATVNLDRSSVRLLSNNWLQITNGSGLALDNARLAFTDYFTWLVNGSAVSVGSTIVNLQDVLAWFNTSALTFANSTLSFGAGSYPVPSGYSGNITPQLYVNSSAISVLGSSWTLRDVPLYIDASSLSLSNSTITLYNSTMQMSGDTLNLNNSQILLYNSSLLLLSNTTSAATVSNVTLYSATNTSLPTLILPLANGTTANVTAGPYQALVGFPLGAVTNVNITGANLDIALADGPAV